MNEEDAFEIVRHSFENGRMPHAYIVAGSPRGNGLRLAEKIAAFLLCPNKIRPCMNCADCENAIHHRHADTLWIEPEKKSRIISVDVIREVLLHWAESGSYAGGWKICVVLFADRLNDNSANAFLKTLEEPAEKTLFLLVTDKPESLLTTVISRCQRLDLNEGRIPPAEPWRGRVGEILAKHSNASALRVFATAGSLVDLFDEIKEVAEKMSATEHRTSEMEEDEDIVNAWISARSKEMRQAVFEAIKDWYRDILVLASCEGQHDGVPIFFDEHRDVLLEKASKTPVRRAIQYVSFVDDMMTHIEVRNIRENLVFPYWFTWLK